MQANFRLSRRAVIPAKCRLTRVAKVQLSYHSLLKSRGNDLHAAFVCAVGSENIR
jgi:hypothetical protein